jgi:pescadillo protein
VDNDEEGYVPEYAETIKRLQDAAKSKVLPLPGLGDEAQENSMVDARSEYNEVAEKKRKVSSMPLQHTSLLYRCTVIFSIFAAIAFCFCVMPFPFLFQSWTC